MRWRRFSRLAPRSPPLWWQQGWPRQRAGSVAEAEFLAPLGELLMPGMPIGDMFRNFKSPAGWGGNYLEPDLTAFGLLKEKDAALFVEYDGYYRHATREGMKKDLLKNAALLDFAPPGSFVVRIGHQGRSQLNESVLWVRVKPWRRGDRLSLMKALKNTLEETVPRLKHALCPSVQSCLEAHLAKKASHVTSQSVQDFCKAAIDEGKGNTTDEIVSHLNAEGFAHGDVHRLQRAVGGGVSIKRTLQPRLQWLLDLGLTKGQVAKALATHPPILGYSIERNLNPTIHWFLELGLTQSQVVKAVATYPSILGLSIEQNLNPTIHWFLDLGLTRGQVAKAVATHPPILGYSIERNLNPTVHWFLDLGLTKGQVAKALATHPPILGYSIERNLNPTIHWFLDLGLTQSQVVKAVATCPSILGLSIERNLNPTIHWFLDLGLTRSQVAKAVARYPRILSYSVEQNFKPTVQWFLDLGLTKSQVARVIADFPSILGLSVDNRSCKVKLLQSFLTTRGATELIAQWPLILAYSQQRLEDRLHILAGQNSLAKVISAMVLTDEAFHKRFLAQKQCHFEWEDPC